MNDIDYWNSIQELEDLIVDAVLHKDWKEARLLRIDLLTEFKNFKEQCPNEFDFPEVEELLSEVKV